MAANNVAIRHLFRTTASAFTQSDSRVPAHPARLAGVCDSVIAGGRKNSEWTSRRGTLAILFDRCSAFRNNSKSLLIGRTFLKNVRARSFFGAQMSSLGLRIQFESEPYPRDSRSLKLIFGIRRILPLPCCFFRGVAQQRIAAYGLYLLHLSFRIDLQFEQHISLNVSQFRQLRIFR